MSDGIPYQKDFFDAGWIRWLPKLSWRLNMLVSCLTLDEATGSPWEQPAGSRANIVLEQIGGPEASAWVDDDDELDTAEAAEEIAFDQARRARLLEALAPFGFGAKASAADLLGLMRSLGMVSVERDEVGEEIWRAVDPLPLPEERLELTPAEREKENRLRLDGMYGALQSTLVGLLTRESTDMTRTSLQRLGERLEVDPEDARQALLLVLESRSFSANRDVARLQDHQVVEITVDRGTFEDEFIGVRLTIPGEDQD